MIVFDLICSSQHRFEGWFASNEDFERQKRTRVLTCPTCATAHVEKLPVAKIRIAESRPSDRNGSAAAEQHASPREIANAVKAFVDHVLRHTEDVGRAFPAEARKIHYEEAPPRGIRGTASHEEVAGLLDEGIEVMPLPISAKDELH